MKPLIGDVTVQFICPANNDALADKLEAARIEQQEICGYPLVLAVRRQIQLKDLSGDDFFEVFATFAPRVNQDGA